MRWLPVRLCLGAAIAAASSGAPLAPEVAAIIDSHAIVLHAPAGGPTKLMAQGPLLGNGDVGVMQSGPADQLVFHLGKNDFWSIKHQSPIACGQLRILIPGLRNARYQTTCDLRLAEIRGNYSAGASALATRARVDARQNLLCVELHNTGTSALGVEVRTLQGNGTPPTGGDPAGGGFLYWPDAPDPAGRRLAVITRIDGMAAAGPITLGPGKSILITTAIASDRDAAGRDPLDAARAMAGGATPETHAARTAAHRQWWNDFWSRSFIEIPDKVIEQCWYTSCYIMGSCSRAGKVAPGLWGNWLTTDTPAWHGDYHLNYNFQAPFYGLYATNHVDTTLPFYDAMIQSIPRGRKIAAARGWRGIHLPVSIGPWGMCPEGDNADWGQRSNAVYSAMLFLWYWQYTRDKDWLAASGYPYLREVAAFWEDYLKSEAGPDGTPRHVIHNDSVHEGSGPDFNPIVSLGLVKTLFANMVPLSMAIGADADKRGRWQDIHDRLSAFPVQEKNGKTVFRYTEKGLAWWNGNTIGIQHIFPAGAIGLDSDPRLLAISRDTIDAMGRWRDDNGSSSWYAACARVGYDPARILARLREMYDHHVLPNKLLNFGGGGIENVSPSLAVTEMLLQSHDGVIRVFPCWPRGSDARFGTLRATGAFLVSASLRGGIIPAVEITSEAGGDCVLVNPWPGSQVNVIRDGHPAESTGGARFTLMTRAGEALMLQPGAAR